MGWELRSGKLYYYRKRREGGRVISEYVGRNDLAELMADQAEEQTFTGKLDAEIELEERKRETDMEQQLAVEASALVVLLNNLLKDAGYHKHKGQWRRIMKNQKIITQRTQHPQYEILKLYDKMALVKEPDAKDVERFRELAITNPGLWPFTTQLSQGLRQRIVGLIASGNARALMLAEIDILEQELGYASATGLEKLLLDHILTARVRLYWVEHLYTYKVCESKFSLEAGAWWDNLLSATHNRFLRAVETLARVRRLAKSNSLFQFNIANVGGRQIVVSGTSSQAQLARTHQQQLFPD